MMEVLILAMVGSEAELEREAFRMASGGAIRGVPWPGRSSGAATDTLEGMARG